MTGHRLVRALDLVDDADLIRAYEAWHRPGGVWPEVVAHIRAQGILVMEIWRTGDRLVMIMEVAPDFPRPVPTPPRIDEWETLMDRFQRRLPGVDPDGKWAPMARIFSLAEQGSIS